VSDPLSTWVLIGGLGFRACTLWHTTCVGNSFSSPIACPGVGGVCKGVIRVHNLTATKFMVASTAMVASVTSLRSPT